MQCSSSTPLLTSGLDSPMQNINLASPPYVFPNHLLLFCEKLWNYTAPLLPDYLNLWMINQRSIDFQINWRGYLLALSSHRLRQSSWLKNGSRNHFLNSPNHHSRVITTWNPRLKPIPNDCLPWKIALISIGPITLFVLLQKNSPPTRSTGKKEGRRCAKPQ